MKPRTLLSLIGGVCALAFVSSTAAELKVVAHNPSAFPRLHETIEIPLERIHAALGGLHDSRLAVTVAGSAVPLPVQFTDDVLLVQADFAPGESKEFSVREWQGAPPQFPSHVDGRYVLPREDYAWENDRIAFRMYGPALAASVNNGIDVWTKRVPYLIVEKWYKESESAPPGKDTYHEDRGEGADFFEVGRSLGAGGSGLWIDGHVLQPGVFTSHKTLANGPIRVSFELLYDWTVDGHPMVEHKTISLDAGHHLNKVQVRFEGTPAGKTLTVACGLVKRVNTVLTKDPERCWMGLWGPTNADSVNGDLGTGVVLGRGGCLRFGEDTAQYLLLVSLAPGKTLTYYAGAGWTRNGDFSSSVAWNRSLDRKAQSLAEPLQLHYTVVR
jgi:hypothetical protein